jgi:hypothetical protein
MRKATEAFTRKDDLDKIKRNRLKVGANFSANHAINLSSFAF